MRAQGGDRGPRAKYRAVLDALTFEAFSDSFKQARGLKRQVSIFVGPPNSGKTHSAMQELAGAASGAYLAPLRLLALEGRDGLAQLGKQCDLLTGEDWEPAAEPGADGVAPRSAFVSSTVEMVDTGTVVDVCVIDECVVAGAARAGGVQHQLRAPGCVRRVARISSGGQRARCARGRRACARISGGQRCARGRACAHISGGQRARSAAPAADAPPASTSVRLPQTRHPSARHHSTP